jgi:GNAT superfamily N-acetyltransferase
VFTLSLAQQKQAQNIVDLTLGEGYIDVKKIKSSGYQKKIIYLIQQQHQIIGIAWVKYLNREKLINKTHNKLSYSNLTPIIDVVAIHPRFQKKGIGKQLFNSFCLQKKYTKILCFAWDNNGKVHLNKLLVLHHFTKITGFKKYYLNDSIQQNFSCSACGFPCKCGIQLYRRGL